MVSYYIYHIVGNKVGCSIDPLMRRYCRGKDEAVYDGDTQILEIIDREMDDEESWKIAGDREIYWRQKLGFKPDCVISHYQYCRANLVKSAQKNTREHLSRAGRSRAPENNPFHDSDIGKMAVQRQLANGTHINQLGKSGFQTFVKCPHCGKTGRNAAMKRWHFENCKEKSNGDQ